FPTLIVDAWLMNSQRPSYHSCITAAYPRPVKLLRGYKRVLAQYSIQIRIVKKQVDLPREVAGIAWFEQQSILPVSDQFGQSARPRSYHRQTGRHGFEADHGHSFSAAVVQYKRWDYQCVALIQQPASLRRIDLAQKARVYSKLAGRLFEAISCVSIARDQ